MDGHTAFERHLPGMLDSSPIGEWIAKRHSQFDDISPSLYRCQHKFDALFC